MATTPAPKQNPAVQDVVDAFDELGETYVQVGVILERLQSKGFDARAAADAINEALWSGRLIQVDDRGSIRRGQQPAHDATQLAQQLRAEEVAAIEAERNAFEWRSKAIANVQRQLLPLGNGQPTEHSLRELDEADLAWRTAHADVDRIVAEIRSGKRR